MATTALVVRRRNWFLRTFFSTKAERALANERLAIARKNFSKAIGDLKLAATNRPLPKQFGDINPKMKCPHCGEVGCVRAKRVSRSKGISGGKAVGAILTGGLSIVATGISRHEGLTQARCDNCESQWDF